MSMLRIILAYYIIYSVKFKPSLLSYSSFENKIYVTEDFWHLKTAAE